LQGADWTMEAVAMRAKGKITTWNDGKGYGFITPAAGGKQIFVHIRAFANRNRRPQVNEVVSYALSADRQGRPCAVRATLAGDRFQQSIEHSRGLLSLVAAAVFLAIVGASVAASMIPPAILVVYLVTSVITFIVYARDKSAARKGDWRTSENTLHLLSLAGGWPGALVAQQKLRHKSRKQSFRLVFRATVVLNTGYYVWLYTPDGTAALRALMDSIA
jgi:uncharacterized membrane protein YsdA (DUF1294 family)/cold shock CspA family protein